MRTLYRIQLQFHLLEPRLAFTMLRHCRECTLSRLPPQLHTVRIPAPVSAQQLTISSLVTRHLSHLSVGAHTASYTQPHYYTNGYHYPSPNPPPYTEYATQSNRLQSFRHPEGHSSYWTGVTNDTSRYLGGQSNRHVTSSSFLIGDYMRPYHLAGIRIINTICNMRLTIPIPPIRSPSPSFSRLHPPSPIQRLLSRAYIPPPLHSPLHLMSVRFLKRSSAPNRNPHLSSIPFWISPVASSSVRRQPSTPTRPPPRDVTGASASHDIPVLTHSSFHRASQSHRRSANQ